MRKKRKKEIEHNNAHILANTIRKQNDKTKCQEKKNRKKPTNNTFSCINLNKLSIKSRKVNDKNGPDPQLECSQI